MKDAALYVFYSSPRTCARRLRLMRSFSPDAFFYGICTDRPGQQQRYRPVFDALDDAWAFPFVDPKWHWHNLDQVVCTWFVRHGNNLPFDRLLVLDWDVLLLDSITRWTAPLREQSVRFIDVWKNVETENNHWTHSSKPAFVEFCSQFADKNAQAPVFHNAFLFAYALPRRALEDCARAVLDYSGYCEYRLPTLLHSRGYELQNFSRPDDWHRFANVNGRSISRELIQKELARPDGWRLFHPVYEPYQSGDLRLSPTDWIAEGCLYRTVSRSIKEFVKRRLRPAPL